MSNTNCLEGIQCPECEHHTEFFVTMTAVFSLRDEGTEQNGDSEWDDDSPCECSNCGYSAKMADFCNSAGNPQ